MKEIKFILFVLFAIFIIGCSENSTEPVKDENTDPQFPMFPLNLPELQSQNSDYQDLKNVANVLKQNHEFPWNVMKIYQPKKNGNLWTRTFLMGDFTAVLTVERKENEDLWTLVLNGTDDNSNITYYNYLEREIHVENSGSKISSKLYEENSSKIWATIDFEKLSDNSWEGNVNFIGIQRIEFKQNKNKSGELLIHGVYNTPDLITYKSFWNETGNGEVWKYDDSGNEIYHGAW